MTPEEIVRKFEREVFPVFLLRNYTADTIVGQFDENGNILPSVEEERRRVQARIADYLRTSLRALLLHVGEEMPKKRDYCRCMCRENEDKRHYNAAIDDCKRVIEKMIEEI